MDVVEIQVLYRLTHVLKFVPFFLSDIFITKVIQIIPRFGPSASYSC